MLPLQIQLKFLNINNMAKEKFSQSITFKAMIIAALTLILLIPNSMIQSLIRERQQRSYETIEKINEKWSLAQTICGPILSIPYEIHDSSRQNLHILQYQFHITPEELVVDAKLLPEERYYGIYKTILYKSDITISGKFAKFKNIKAHKILWEEAFITMGVSDLKGITNNVIFTFNNQPYTAESKGNDRNIGKKLTANIQDSELSQKEELAFECRLNLNGSSKIEFIPVGKSTKVQVAGAWKSPGFIGNFSPEYTINEQGFDATWNVMHFNHSIPENWIDDKVDYFANASFGVDLVDTVNHYQQNMRSAKYALMFIALTFVVFFFVEVLTKKRIHPIQYLLVGIALILFYSLLLSISEQINFALAYLIAAAATIGLITIYAHSIFKSGIQTGILAFILCLLYVFLYVILQLEDIALLVGSIGLFTILGVIMFISRKITFYKQENLEEK